MSPLIPRGLAELFYGGPTLAAYANELPVNGRMAVISPGVEDHAEMLTRLAADRRAQIL